MAETLVKEQKVAQVPKVSEPIFGQKERKLLLDPLTDNNPITVQVLGVCSALAVTSLVAPSVVMAIAVTAVTALSSLVTSMVRNYIPKSVRMIAQLVIVAVLVTIVELVLKAYNFTIYKQLSVYIGLIITNCIVMGRLEAFAMANKPWRSFIDGIGNGLGYGAILIVVGIIRELLGKGTLVGVPIIGASNEQVSYFINTAAESGFGSFFSWYANNNLMVLPTAAMFIVAIMIWIQRSRSPKLIDIS
ncbi:MAG: NADH:ubiquinone reductase (Na(+)-transporting) subunit D [Saprospiraceae bacterium]|nr:NADH:ubiquinone reductase (Na(+)-transporting) subunit D [Saprospiraceae bacterium]